MSDTEKPQLKPANDNPWYCLATLHGEQPVDGLDQGLADKNYLAWNRWLTLGPADFGVLEEYASSFAGRTSLRLPEPGSNPDFSHTRFDRAVNFANFHFRKPTDFRSAMFSGDANFSGALFFNVDFRLAKFCADIQFPSAQFDAVNFQSATFSDMADFNSAKFSGMANFRSATFSPRYQLHQHEVRCADEFCRCAL